MVAVDLLTFMQQVIERLGREPNSIDGNSYTWLKGDEEIVLVIDNKMADIEVRLYINWPSVDPEDLFYHHYELTEFKGDNGASIGTDGSSWTYDNLVKVVSQQVSASLNLAWRPGRRGHESQNHPAGG